MVILGTKMHWIASTLCNVCIHSWHALVALDFFADLMLFNEKVQEKTPLTVISKMKEMVS